VLGERAKRLKARCLHGKHGSICGGHKRERVCEIPGEIWMFAGHSLKGQATLAARCEDECPEVSRGNSRRKLCAEGPNARKETGALNFDGGEEADKYGWNTRGRRGRIRTESGK
jgi:hypothetical protein